MQLQHTNAGALDLNFCVFVAGWLSLSPSLPPTLSPVFAVSSPTFILISPRNGAETWKCKESGWPAVEWQHHYIIAEKQKCHSVAF